MDLLADFLSGAAIIVSVVTLVATFLGPDVDLKNPLPKFEVDYKALNETLKGQKPITFPKTLKLKLKPGTRNCLIFANDGGKSGTLHDLWLKFEGYNPSFFQQEATLYLSVPGESLSAKEVFSGKQVLDVIKSGDNKDYVIESAEINLVDWKDTDHFRSFCKFLLEENNIGTIKLAYERTERRFRTILKSKIFPPDSVENNKTASDSQQLQDFLKIAPI